MKNFEALSKLEDEVNCKKDLHHKKSQAEILIDICKAIELFHGPDNEAYATIVRNDHKETWSLNNKEFKSWLRQQYYSLTGSAPADKVFKDVLQTLAAKALFEGEEHQVFLRLAHLSNAIYLDLSNKNWEVVEITTSGWRILNESPVKFRRVTGMEPLPIPTKDELPKTAIELLRSLVNVEGDNDFKLLVGWLLSILGTNGPYLVLVLYGEQGTAKSTLVKILRSLIDPNISPLRRPPRNTDDLMVMAKGNHIVALDNMSHLPEWMSDDLCVLSTGGGLSKRKHYSDDEEIVIDAKRPIIANGIDEFVARGDLASRSIFLSLPLINGQSRKSEKDFWQNFNLNRATIFGALLSAVVEGLRNIESTILNDSPRMADAWRFITAAEIAFGWTQGTCLRAFQDNQQKANEVVLNSSPLYPFIQAYAEIGFTGTPQELLVKIRSESQRFNISTSELRFFPSNPKTLSDRLRRLAPALRLDGIEITFDKTSGSNSKRMVTITKGNNLCDASDAAKLLTVSCDEGDAQYFDNSFNNDFDWEE